MGEWALELVSVKTCFKGLLISKKIELKINAGIKDENLINNIFMRKKLNGGKPEKRQVTRPGRD